MASPTDAPIDAPMETLSGGLNDGPVDAPIAQPPVDMAPVTAAGAPEVVVAPRAGGFDVAGSDDGAADPAVTLDASGTLPLQHCTAVLLSCLGAAACAVLA